MDNDQFYVIIYPGADDKIVAYITEPKIHILNYSGLFEKTGQYTIHPIYDAHPSKMANMVLAKQMVQDI